MVSAAYDIAWIDPFGKPAAAQSEPVADAPPSAAAENTAATTVEPSELGIVLGGIMIGPRSRVATINGDALHEGDQLTVTDKRDKSVQHRLRVLRIRPSEVLLEANGQTIPLPLAKSKLAHGDEIERAKSNRVKPKPAN